MDNTYTYEGSVFIEEGITLEPAKFKIRSVTIRENKISAEVGFLLNEEKDYQAVRFYETEIPEGSNVFDSITFDQMVTEFMIQALENA